MKNLLVNTTALLGLLRQVEWAGTARGQGSGPMGSGGDGPIFGRCPSCKGIQPGGAELEFTRDAIGHRANCPLRGMIQTLEEADDR